MTAHASALAVPAAVTRELAQTAELDLERLYEAHSPAIVGRLLHLVGDRARAEDLCQETFVIAARRLDGFRGEAAVSTWLHGIAINLARDERKRSSRRRGLLARFFNDPGERPALAADASVQHGQLVERLQAAIAELDDPHREAYVLRIVEALPLADCAALLGASVSTISDRARRAERKVRAHFENEDLR
jgi:RNA polymerase sigma-70 factor (ECF subfamily)